MTPWRSYSPCKVDANSREIDDALLPDWWLYDTHDVGPRCPGLKGFGDRLVVARWDPLVVAVIEIKVPGEKPTEAEKVFRDKWKGPYVVLATADEARDFSKTMRDATNANL